jgi:hypothetical protein
VSPILTTARRCNASARCSRPQHRNQRSASWITVRTMPSTSRCCGTRAQIKCSSLSRTTETASHSSSPCPEPQLRMHSATRTPTAPAACSQSSPEAQHDQQSYHISIGALPNRRISQDGRRGAGGNCGDTSSPRGSADDARAVAAGAAPPSPRSATAGCIRRSLIHDNRPLAGAPTPPKLDI